MTAIRRALISVSDKTDIVAFAQGLAKMEVEILSTGGTAMLLKENGVAVVEVSDYTGFPEMMGGRLKTLHPRIHGGILGRRGQRILLAILAVADDQGDLTVRRERRGGAGRNPNGGQKDKQQVLWYALHAPCGSRFPLAHVQSSRVVGRRNRRMHLTKSRSKGNVSTIIVAAFRVCARLIQGRGVQGDFHGSAF